MWVIKGNVAGTITKDLKSRGLAVEPAVKDALRMKRWNDLAAATSSATR